jgi:hypothetical protein
MLRNTHLGKMCRFQLSFLENTAPDISPHPSLEIYV